jgi:hypothetical protein
MKIVKDFRTGVEAITSPHMFCCRQYRAFASRSLRSSLLSISIITGIIYVPKPVLPNTFIEKDATFTTGFRALVMLGASAGAGGGLGDGGRGRDGGRFGSLVSYKHRLGRL